MRRINSARLRTGRRLGRYWQGASEDIQPPMAGRLDMKNVPKVLNSSKMFLQVTTFGTFLKAGAAIPIKNA